MIYIGTITLGTCLALHEASIRKIIKFYIDGIQKLDKVKKTAVFVNTMGWVQGFIRQTDLDKKVFLLITPLSHTELIEVNAIFKGNIIVPDEILLKQFYIDGIQKLDKVKKNALFVNTMGWIQGTGELCQKVRAAVEPTVRIEILPPRPNFSLATIDAEGVTFFKIPSRSFSARREASMFSASEMRNFVIVSYFGLCLNPQSLLMLINTFNPTQMIYIGTITLGTCPAVYNFSNTGFIKFYIDGIQKLDKVKKNALFVNTMGWIQGTGESCQKVRAAVEPTVIIEILPPHPNFSLTRIDADSVTFFKIPSRSREACAFSASEMRNFMIVSYFGLCLNPQSPLMLINTFNPTHIHPTNRFG
ncbi:unnamed protein product [Larinioides sclopetarius]|uniref:Clp1 P-loop domain-containing protein n=1 Tax=Larinioides sclopetarius TaxID=280406 RepID=A0AAV1ZEF0_9ARAC